MIQARKYLLFTALGVVVTALDQWTKVWSREVLKPLGASRPRVIIEGFFDLRYSENPGVAFGMLQGLPAGQVLLSVVAAAALGLVLYYLKNTSSSQVRVHCALGLVGGGAVGNLIDRVAFGKVSDFIVWKYREHEWPAFNLADAALVVGVLLMAIDMLPGRKADSAAADRT